jgi:hypothetical protein
MKHTMKTRVFTCISMLGTIVLSAGCQMNSTPVKPVTDTSLSTGQMVGVGVVTAGGAAVGQRFDPKWGAPIGAVVGGAASALAFSMANKNAAQGVAEAYEQGLRDAKMAPLDRWWDQQQNKPLDREGKDNITNSFKVKPLAYPGGSYHGIIYAPRVLTDSAINEPTR